MQVVSDPSASRRGELFPDLPEYGVIAASYNNVDERCVVDDHPDHRAVHVGIFRDDQGTRGPQWGRTCGHDVDVARVSDVASDIWDQTVGVAPDGVRTGALQVHYGWLMDGPWPVQSGLENTGHFSRRQAFWQRF